jgi:hypothetical protein
LLLDVIALARSIALAPIAFITTMNVRAMSDQLPPFAAFRAELVHQNALRAAISAAYRRPEPECLPMLLDLATLAPKNPRVQPLSLATLRRRRHRGSRSRATSIRFPRITS